MAEPPVYVVLGASGHLGSAVCREIYAKGARLMMGARAVEKLDTLQEELEDALYFGFDAERMFEVERCVEQALNMWGRVDAVVNCIGALGAKPAHETTEDEWMEMVNINLSSAFAAVRSAAKLMMAEGGSVTLVSSQAGLEGYAGFDAFAAVSGGVASLALAAAKTYKPFNIRINAVAPGLLKTPSGEAVASRAPEGTPSHSPEEAAKAIAWLANPDCAETGLVLGVAEGLAKAG